ncbi:hypothetical protein D3C86_2124520 [compost metagenome]
MHDDVVDDLNRRHGQPVVEGQLFIGGAGPPFRCRFFNLERLRLHFELGLIDREALGDHFFTAGKIKFLQPQL